jgi:hypothetical protein
MRKRASKNSASGGKKTTRYKVPELLRHVQGLSLPASPLPSRFWRHADVIDPIAEAYADIYRARHGFPVQVEALERFLYAEFFEEHPHLLASALLHELGHVGLRHGELYADAGMPSLPGMQMPSPFFHRTGWLPWGVSEDLLKRVARVALMDDRVRAILKPERFEPDWIYGQAQRFAAAFMIPHARLREHLGEPLDFTRWHPVYELARQFATSPAMMRYRLEHLGYITMQGRDIRPGIHLQQGPML